jgi:peptidoglycan-associated lipoprotein
MAAALRDPAEGLSDIFFDIDSASLPDRSRQVVEANARLLKATQGWRVHIEGHCDERGSDAYNIVLGERRAQAVRQALADLGIPVNQVHVVSYGEERPLCEAHEESCWHKNRRAHFVVDIPAP